MKTIDFSGDNGIGTNFKIALHANLIFASLGERGCMVVDGQNYTKIYEYKSNQFLSAIGVTSDAKYVFLSQNNSLAMFEFVNKKEFVFQSSASFNNCVILDIIVSSNNRFAFIAGEKGILAVYNIADPSRIFRVAELQTAATLINRINFSKDEKFLFLGNNELGFNLIKLDFNQLNGQENSVILKLVGNAIPYWKIFQCIPTQDLKYVYCTDYWYGVYIATLDDIINQPESNYPVQIHFKLRSWPLNSINPLVFSIELFNDDQYLLVSVRSLGIFIFDIRDRENLILYQKIYVPGQPVQLSISPIDGNIIYANKIQLNIYKQTVPNLNNRNPNLFNNHQSMIVQYYPQVFYRWRCYLSRDNQYYYGTQDFMGLVIAHIPNSNPYNIQFKLLIPAIPPNFTEATTVTKNKKFIFQAVQENGCTLKIHDISDLNNVKIVQCLTINEPTQHAEEQAISDDETILVLSYDDGILIIDVSIPSQAEILSYWKMEGLMIGNLAGVMITKDKKWVLGTARGYGVCALNIEDPKNPIYTDSINTQGGEGIKASPYNHTLAYLLDGYRGVAVIDLSYLPNLKIISRIQLRGWTNDLTVFTNDQFLLVSTMDDGQLTLINSSNPKNLYIISMFQQGDESSQSSCFTSDFKYAFINNEFGTRIMPLTSQIILHTQISQSIFNEDNLVSSQVSLGSEDILYVGQNIIFDFIPIYQKEGMVISKILYYDQSTLELQELPSWINVFNNNFSIKFQVSKESLRSNVLQPVQNTILVKSALQLNANSFIYNQDGFQTNITLADKIFKIVSDKFHFLDENGFVTDIFCYNSNITLTDLNLQDSNLLEFIQKQVKITLQFAVFFNPVVFLTQNSLLFDQDNKIQMIKTPSQNLKISISFINNQGNNCVFVNIPYSGCIQELSSDQSTIQISGSTLNINNVLFHQVIYHCKYHENNIYNNQIGFQIVDNLNYDYINQFNVTKSTFLKQLKDISINTKMPSLQQQFENKYQNSEIPIETDINFSFENSYFIQPQSNFLPITYSLYYYDSTNDNYTLVNSNYWIKLEATQLKFYGFASSNMFQTVQQLKIVASNGYVECSDFLKININLVSFLYTLNIILRAFGIIIGFFGLYKFKSFICNTLINDKVLYSDETAVINQPFFKQITIIGDDFEIAKLLFNQFKRKFFKGKIQFVNRPCRENIKTTQESQNSYPNQDAIRQSQLSNNNNNNNTNNISSFNNNINSNNAVRQQQQNIISKTSNDDNEINQEQTQKGIFYKFAETYSGQQEQCILQLHEIDSLSIFNFIRHQDFKTIQIFKRICQSLFQIFSK
ncbi:transmembrane protein, putative (macronuclear) [Tetrahymena thermophila SB210]|uniref:Transmembrane protein, putative n=1 Tax=Tetrahymena thermophila (strain SB210) TaxID=312017 RepID=Q23TA1_TETTS|nr:transmembrane protein, putative [Tetrahymena thermophila SB210]EAR99805.2 transmembrane protein, putative [Tetrahymena thermophila SB210]|eukprot:XP_001020050.2 transmembrane protein, putative [Tetrahymena thermophila SB210]